MDVGVNRAVPDYECARLIGQLVQSITDTPLILKGTNYPSQEVEDFLMYDFLGYEYTPQHIYNEHAIFMFQLIVYSLPPEHRIDRQLYPHMKLANVYKQKLQRLRILPTQIDTCIQINECKISYLDLRNLGEFSPEIRATSPPLHLMSAVMLFQGYSYGWHKEST